LFKANRPVDTIDALRELIPVFGVVDPIVKNPAGQVIDGALRIRVLEELGIDYDVQIMDTDELIIGHAVSEMMNRERVSAPGANHGEQVKFLGDRYSVATIAAAVGVGTNFVRSALAGEVPQVVPNPAPPMPPLHECATYMPELTPEQYESLRADIAANGQNRAIVLTADGLLIDGRARWQVCAELGVTPVIQRYDGNPWERSLVENVARLPNPMERLMIAASLPVRVGGGIRVGDMRPASSDFLVEHFGVTWGMLKPARQVVNTPGTEVLCEGIREGVLPAGTAKRIMKTLPPRRWRSTVARHREALAAGVKPPPLPEYPDEIARRERAAEPIQSSQDRNRHRYITLPHMYQANDNLVALGIVVGSSDGLDPSITGDQAAACLRDLTANRRSLNRLISLLKERKEATP
jgi:hypothetical protein